GNRVWTRRAMELPPPGAPAKKNPGKRKEMIETAQIEARSEQIGGDPAAELAVVSGQRKNVAVVVEAAEFGGQAEPLRGVVGERSRAALIAEALEWAAGVEVHVVVHARDLPSGHKPTGRFLVGARRLLGRRLRGVWHQE